MKPRISFITLAMNDFEKSFHFYRGGLGLPAEGIVGNELEHGASVASWRQPSGIQSYCQSQALNWIVPTKAA